MPRRGNGELVRHAPAMPDHIDLQPGTMSGVDAVTPLLNALYNTDDDAAAELGSFNSHNSPNGAIWCDKTIIAQKVQALASKNGDNPMVSDANLATIARWVSWASRRFGIARSQRIAQAKQAMLNAQSVPDPTPAE